MDGQRVEIIWDFRRAKFSSTPEPSSDYYVALVFKEEVVLLLGDLKDDAFKRTRSRPSLEEAILLSKKENVCGKRLFCTRAMLNAGKKEHDMVIENSLSGPGDPKMWISVEGEVLIRVMNLNWRFRGNETVMVNNVPLQIFWDVVVHHPWIRPWLVHLQARGPELMDTDLDSRNCNEVCFSESEFDHDHVSPSVLPFPLRLED